MRYAIVAAAVVLIGSAAVLFRNHLRAREETAWAERAAAAVTRAHPAWEVSRSSPGILGVTYKGSRVDIRLENMRRSAGDDAALFEEQVLTAAESAAHVIDRASHDAGVPPRFEDVRTKVYPVLVPRGFAPGQKLFTLPFAGDVLEAFVFDGEHHQRYLDEPTFSGWGVDHGTLLAAAAAALAARARAETWSAKRPTDPSATGRFVALDVSDGYAAARLVVPEVRERLGKELGYPFFVGIPNRDFLVAWSSDYTFADQFANKVREDFSRRSYPVSPEVFRVDASGVSPSGTAAVRR